MTKIKVYSYGAKFNLHCPRCGKDEFIKDNYDSGVHKYHLCKTCGADVAAFNENGGLSMVTVIEEDFYNFGQNDGIENILPGKGIEVTTKLIKRLGEDLS